MMIPARKQTVNPSTALTIYIPLPMAELLIHF
jgi:hypothetical protein